MIGGKKDLGNAIALNSILFNSARLIGPLIAGVLIASVGEEACFFINSLTYIVAIAALLAMEITPAYREESEKDVLKDFTEGLNYVVNFPPTRLILLLLAVVSLAGMPYVVLMPVFATEVLKGGSEMFAFLMSASGVGALFGAVYLASRTTVVGLMRQLAVAAAVFGAGLVIFAFSRAAWLSLAILVLVGFSMIVHAAACNTVLQTVIDDGKRGRVMGFYVMSMMGMMPFGSLIAGSLASRIGAPYTLVIGGAVTFFAALAFYSKLPYLRGIVRPIYSKIGIIPES
jgi:MFS family permease